MPFFFDAASLPLKTFEKKGIFRPQQVAEGDVMHEGAMRACFAYQGQEMRCGGGNSKVFAGGLELVGRRWRSGGLKERLKLEEWEESGPESRSINALDLRVRPTVTWLLARQVQQMPPKPKERKKKERFIRTPVRSQARPPACCGN